MTTIPRDHQQKQDHQEHIPMFQQDFCFVKWINLIANVLNFHRPFFVMPNSFNQDYNYSNLSAVYVQAVYKKHQLQSRPLPLWLTPVLLESFPAWRKPGKTLRGSLSINTGVALSPRAAHHKPPAGSCFPCLACIKTGIIPNLSQGMTGGPRAIYN